MDVIFKRRSIRQFTDKSVSDELIKKVLAAGMSAPSAGNEQPWHFIVIKDKETLRKLSIASPFAKAVGSAPLGIIICGDLSLERHEGFWVQDCSAATQNMLLEAAHLGLGSVWLGIYPLEDRVSYIRQQFNLSKNIIPFAIIPLGYPTQEQKFVDRYKEERVHCEKW